MAPSILPAWQMKGMVAGTTCRAVDYHIGGDGANKVFSGDAVVSSSQPLAPIMSFLPLIPLFARLWISLACLGG